MSDWPSVLLPPLPTIFTQSEEALGAMVLGAAGSAPTSQTVVQNQAYYVPFKLSIASTVVKMMYVVGSTQNGNVDMGLYDKEGNYLISSGSTAQGAANTLQELDITDTSLNPGIYYIAFASNSTTATMFGNSSTDEGGIPLFAFYIQASAFPLPTTTGTPVRTTAGSPTVPLLGVSFDTLI